MALRSLKKKKAVGLDSTTDEAWMCANEEVRIEIGDIIARVWNGECTAED